MLKRKYQGYFKKLILTITKNTKIMNYKALLLRDDEQKFSESIEFAVEEAKQQIDADILATKRSLSTSKMDLQQLKGKTPFSAKALVEKHVEVEGYEKGLKILELYKSELFSDDSVLEKGMTSELKA